MPQRLPTITFVAMLVLATTTRPGAAGPSNSPRGLAVGTEADVQVEVEVVLDVEAQVHAQPQGSVEPAAPPITDGSPSGGEGPLHGHRWEVGLALAVPLGTGDLGFHAVAGRQWGGLRLTAELSMLPVSGDRWRPGSYGEPALALDCGQLTRLGLTARQRVAVGAPHAQAAIYLEAGLGKRQVSWARSGESAGLDAGLGVGFEVAGGAARTAGVDMGFRVLAPRSAEPGTARDVTAWFLVGMTLGG